LAGERISAISGFTDNSVLARFRLPRALPEWPSRRLQGWTGPGRCLALADGWSYWSARPLSTLRPGFADIHACDQAAAEHVGMEDCSLGEHGAIWGPHGLAHCGADAAMVRAVNPMGSPCGSISA